MPSHWMKPALATTMLAIMTSTASADAARPAKFVEKLKAGTPQKVVFFGTSLTHQGAWVKQVTDALDKAFPKLVAPHNGAQSGQQSRWGLANLKARVLDQKPDVVFIEFTVNDAVERFKLPVEEARKNVESMIDQIKTQNPDCEIILQITNPVIGRPKGDNGHRPDLPAYQQMYRDLGKERGLLVIDHMPAWQKLLDQGEPEFKKYVPDGLHPAGPGYAKFVTPTILEAIGVAPAK